MSDAFERALAEDSELRALRERVRTLEQEIARRDDEAASKARYNEHRARVLGVPLEAPKWWPAAIDWANRARSARWTDFAALDPGAGRMEDFGELRLGGSNPRGLRVAIFAADLLSIEALIRRVA